MINKILVVEDDKAVSKLLSQFLSKSGFQTKTAKSAEEAENILDNEKIDTVLTDIRLPGTDGIRFTSEVKKNLISM
jgi:DNA-binding response OmpR family regulator